MIKLIAVTHYMADDTCRQVIIYLSEREPISAEFLPLPSFVALVRLSDVRSAMMCEMHSVI